jgi:hypothetical protein
MTDGHDQAEHAERRTPLHRPDARCARCGYRLEGLTSDAACPECGSDARNAIGIIALTEADPTYLAQVSAGTLCLVACGFSLAATAAFAGVSLARGQWWAATEPYLVPGLIGAWFCGGVGMVLVTARERWGITYVPRTYWAGVLRACGVLSLACGAVSVVAFAAEATALAGVTALCAAAGVAVGLLATVPNSGFLARRTPDTRLAEIFDDLLGAMLVLSVLGACALGVGPGLALMLWTFMNVRLWRRIMDARRVDAT